MSGSLESSLPRHMFILIIVFNKKKLSTSCSLIEVACVYVSAIIFSMVSICLFNIAEGSAANNHTKPFLIGNSNSPGPAARIPAGS